LRIGRNVGFIANYNLRFGRRNTWGWSYPGSNHRHWSRCLWNVSLGCYTYYCPNTLGYYYWCAPHNCYYPTTYCPTGSYDYAFADVPVEEIAPVEEEMGPIGPNEFVDPNEGFDPNLPLGVNPEEFGAQIPGEEVTTELPVDNGVEGNPEEGTEAGLVEGTPITLGNTSEQAVPFEYLDGTEWQAAQIEAGDSVELTAAQALTVRYTSAGGMKQFDLSPGSKYDFKTDSVGNVNLFSE